MIHAIILTLLVIIVGDATADFLHLPIPGSIIGLVAATFLFVCRGGPDPAMARMFDGVIRYAPMLFVPAGAGVVANLDVIAEGLMAIGLVITLGTAATIAAAGLIMEAVLKWRERRECAT
jgi:holin-like protein